MTMVHKYLSLASSILGHIFTLFMIAVRKSALTQVNNKNIDVFPSANQIRLCAVASAILAFVTSYAFASQELDPFIYAFIRLAAFFYSCKALDLAVRSDLPPTKYIYENGVRSNKPSPMLRSRDIWFYVWSLLTEMRFASFDIHARQPGRKEIEPAMRGIFTSMPYATVLCMGIKFAPLKAALLLVILRMGLEGAHSAFHPRCVPQFYRPFTARSLGDFWATHWHASATFLVTLAYRPVKKFTGSRALGVLATFALSGVWHGWIAAAIVERPWQVGVEVWALFMLFGAGIVAEKVVWTRQGSWVQGVVVWAVCLHAAGWCWNSLECSSRVWWLRDEASCRDWVY